MISTAAHTRRVLGDKSINTPIKANTPVKVTKGLGVDGAGMTAHAQLMDRVASELKDKRSVGVSSGSPAKRRRIDAGGESASPRRESRRSPSPGLSNISPASSFGNSTLDRLDDSQNTILTVPDDNHVFQSFTNISPNLSQVAPLTTAQIKAKATSARLRLSLASYKVRTNQIDVPISRLEVRPSANSGTPGLPQLRRSHPHTSSIRAAPRTALPSAPSTSLSMSTSTFNHQPRMSFEHPNEIGIEQYREMAKKAVEAGLEEIGSSPPVVGGRSPTSAGEDSGASARGANEGLLSPPVLRADYAVGGGLSGNSASGAVDGLMNLMGSR